MAQVFAITATSDTVRLGGDGTGEIAFTVSNVSGRALRGRAKLSSQDPATTKWLSLAGEAEQDFAVSQTIQFKVKVAPPKGTKAAKYTFRLDAVSVQNPDEDYTQGPSVAFSVTPPPSKEHKPFPWWILVVAAVVLIAVGGGLWYFLHKPNNNNTTQTQDQSAAPTAQVTVPNVRGHSVADATTILSQVPLTVGTVTSKLTDASNVNKILDQQPSDTQQVASGSPVNLVVGSVSVSVPQIVGHPYAEAQTMLQGQGLLPGKVTNNPSGNMSPGAVLSANPAEGQLVATGSAVDLVVQEETVVVPNLISPPQTINQAVISLQNARLKLGTVTGNLTTSNIIAQNPQPGTRQPVGTEVNITVPGFRIIYRNPAIFARPMAPMVVAPR